MIQGFLKRLFPQLRVGPEAAQTFIEIDGKRYAFKDPKLLILNDSIRFVGFAAKMANHARKLRKNSVSERAEKKMGEQLRAFTKMILPDLPDDLSAKLSDPMLLNILTAYSKVIRR